MVIGYILDKIRRKREKETQIDLLPEYKLHKKMSKPARFNGKPAAVGYRTMNGEPIFWGHPDPEKDVKQYIATVGPKYNAVIVPLTRTNIHLLEFDK